MSDVFSRWSRVAAAISVVMMAGLLAGCQVRPLYGEASGTKERLAAVSITQTGGRVGQEVRNQLIFLTSGGAGEPATAQYNLKIAVSSSASSTEVQNYDLTTRTNNNYDGPYPGRVVMAGQYVLTRVSDGQILRSARRSVTAQVDLPQQEFAKIRAIRDAENRAARELAEIIRTDVAATLGR
ncbi:LPS assembly lipoprotein LptE [Agrobacterium sp. El2ro-1b]|uniref:LPS assembly lipoprotein LptE n=1 Tax=Agrobacterium sp. El2ro-1b TaxID=2969528 RepID=UPI003AAA6C0D